MNNVVNKKHPLLSKKQSVEHIAKRVLAYKAGGNCYRSAEYRNKISETLKSKGIIPPSRIGVISWAKGITNETNEKMALISYKRSITQKGKHYSPNTEFKKGSIPFNKGAPENIRDRNKMEYKEWRKEVFKRDNYVCQKYRTRGSDLETHHIFNYSSNPELRFDVKNGCTLSKKAHREFHKIYGNQNNTLEQLNEFLGVEFGEHDIKK